MKRINKRLCIPIVATCVLYGGGSHAPTRSRTGTRSCRRRCAPTNPFFQARSAAIVQLAVFEAVNAIVGDYEPYLGTIAAPPWASPDAAAIAAAHRTLVTLRPGQRRDPRRLAGPVARGDPGRPGQGCRHRGRRGRRGRHAPAPGQRWIGPGGHRALHAGDRSRRLAADAPRVRAGLPARLGPGDPVRSREGSQFRVPPPPALHTGKYAKDYNEVKLVGRVDSPFRPQDRTDVARFYAATSPVQTWNPAARQVSAAQGKTLSENARIFALLAMAIADGSIAVFDTKYYYNRWRPVTAIRAGGIDGNHKTEPDPTWLPLIATPAFPSYPSAHATLSGAARAVLERAFGKHGHAITLTNPAAAGHGPQLHRLGADHRRHRRRPDLRRHPLPVRPGGGCPPGTAGRQVHPPALSALGE